MSKATDLSEARCQALLNYLQGCKRGQPKYPQGFSINDRRGLRQQATSFHNEDGVLYHKKDDVKAGVLNLRRVVVSREEQVRIMRACHDGVDGCHFGRDKTFSKVKYLTF